MQTEESCAPGCYKQLYGYHTGDCPNVTAEDRKRDAKDQSAVDYEQDHAVSV